MLNTTPTCHMETDVLHFISDFSLIPLYIEDCLYVDKSTWCTTNILGPDTAFKCAFGHNADVCCFTCQKYANMSMPGEIL